MNRDISRFQMRVPESGRHLIRAYCESIRLFERKEPCPSQLVGDIQALISIGDTEASSP